MMMNKTNMSTFHMLSIVQQNYHEELMKVPVGCKHETNS